MKGTAFQHIDDCIAEAFVAEVVAEDVHFRKVQRVSDVTREQHLWGNMWIFAVLAFFASPVFHRDLVGVDPVKIAVECFRLMVWDSNAAFLSFFPVSHHCCAEELR